MNWLLEIAPQHLCNIICNNFISLRIQPPPVYPQATISKCSSLLLHAQRYCAQRFRACTDFTCTGRFGCRDVFSLDLRLTHAGIVIAGGQSTPQASPSQQGTFLFQPTLVGQPGGAPPQANIASPPQVSPAQGGFYRPSVSPYGE